MLLKAEAVEVQKHDHLSGLCHYAGSWLFLLSSPSYPVFSPPGQWWCLSHIYLPFSPSLCIHLQVWLLTPFSPLIAYCNGYIYSMEVYSLHPSTPFSSLSERPPTPYEPGSAQGFFQLQGTFSHFCLLGQTLGFCKAPRDKYYCNRHYMNNPNLIWTTKEWFFASIIHSAKWLLFFVF